MGPERHPHFLVPGFYSEFEIDIQDPEAVLVRDLNLCPVVTELVNNCLQAGAEEVTVKIEWGRIVVEDDLAHEDEARKAILTNVRSERPKTTKRPDSEIGRIVGGVGIRSCRDILAGYGGLLEHEETEKGGIRAIATWPIV